jgi:hypothetical protein
MKVKNLIERLKGFNQNKKVILLDAKNTFKNIFEYE